MKRFALNNPLNEIRQYRRRVIVIGVLMLLLLAILIARLVYLQIQQHSYYLTLSRQNLLSVAPIDPSRGLIYDRNGVLLAGNVPVFSLEVFPDKFKKVVLNQSIEELKKIIDISPADMQAFQKQLAEHRRFNSVPLKVKLTDQEIAHFAVNKYRFPGFFIQAHLVRYYPFGPLMAPVLGYVGRINATELAKVDPANYSASNFIGKTGVERYDETLLHGTVGIQQIETGAEGNVVRSNLSRPAIAGDNIYLSIDSRLQAAALQALQGQAGAVVAIDPRNGEVLAMVSAPSFDPNQFVTGISNIKYQALQNDPEHPLLNRALQSEFPPGSTVKPYYALGSLSMGVLTPATSLFCPGFFKLPNSHHVYHDWVHGRGHGSVDAETAIIQSCDVFFYHLGENLGITRMGKILSMFGFGQPTHIDTYSERTGLVPSPAWKERVHHQGWYPGDTVITMIGQGYLLVTPTQVANAMTRMVTRGHGDVPHLLLKSENAKGETASPLPVAWPEINIPAADWNLVLRALREVVSDPRGTSYQSGHTATYTYGGKTGTAQVFSLRANQRDVAKLLPQKLRDHSWFVGFAPADNPRIVIALFVEHGGEGAAPVVARRIFDSYFALYPEKTS